MKKPHSFAPLWIGLGLVAACSAVWLAGVRWNHTASAPLGFYHLLPANDLRVGDQVAICLPKAVGLFGHERGYVTRGSCPGEVSPLLKTIGGVQGHHIEVATRGVLLDGLLLQTAAPTRDGRGRSLEPVRLDRELRRGELWLVSSHERSWDSRYYGVAHQSWVLGRVEPLWTFE